MIFAEFNQASDYSDFYPELAAFVRANFENVEAGLQGDAWIHIQDGNEQVQLDTFSSMQFQIKSKGSCELMYAVIKIIAAKYELNVLDNPIFDEDE
jgi:hypothetical protein